MFCKANPIISWTSALLTSNNFLALFFAPLGVELTIQNISWISEAVSSSIKNSSTATTEPPWNNSTQIILENQSEETKGIRLTFSKFKTKKIESFSTTYITWKSNSVKHLGKDPVSLLIPICLLISDKIRPTNENGAVEKKLTRPKERWHHRGTEEYFQSIYYLSKLCKFSKGWGKTVKQK